MYIEPQNLIDEDPVLLEDVFAHQGLTEYVDIYVFQLLYYGVQFDIVGIYQVRLLQVYVFASVLANAAHHFNFLLGVTRIHDKILYFSYFAIHLEYYLQRLCLFLEVHLYNLRFVKRLKMGDDLVLLIICR